MTLYEICLEIANIENGLAFGEIQFTYDNLMCAMKPGHPADILDDIFTEIGTELYLHPEADIPLEKVKAMHKNLKDFKSAFKIKELNKVLKALKEYISTQEAKD